MCYISYILYILYIVILLLFYIALGWRKKQPIAYVFGRTMCITAEDIVNELSEEN